MVMEGGKTNCFAHVIRQNIAWLFPAEKKPGYMLQLSTGKFDDSLLLPFFLNHIPTADMATKTH
jgi:hypothetical protein